MTNPIDRRNKFSVIYFCGESFLSERAFQSTAICRYARGFADWVESPGGTRHHDNNNTSFKFLESLP